MLHENLQCGSTASTMPLQRHVQQHMGYVLTRQCCAKTGLQASYEMCNDVQDLLHHVNDQREACEDGGPAHA